MELDLFVVRYKRSSFVCFNLPALKIVLFNATISRIVDDSFPSEVFCSCGSILSITCRDIAAFRIKCDITYELISIYDFN